MQDGQDFNVGPQARFLSYFSTTRFTAGFSGLLAGVVILYGKSIEYGGLL
jgi:hypothetical protein